MRITIFLCLVSVIQIFAVPSVGQVKLDLKMKNTTIEDVLLKIEESTNFRFFYQSKDLKAKQLIDIEFKQKTVPEILDEVLPQYQLEYEVFNNYIAIKSKEGGYNSQGAVQEQKAVSGKVTDSSGTPLPGVTVVVKGTTQGTVTNADGNYSITNIPMDATLQFSFVGMKTQEIGVGSQTNINIVMEEETIGLDEVVAIGYGTMKKSDLTGSVQRVDVSLYENQGSTNMIEFLNGTVAGFNSNQGTSASGGGDMEIRGTTSLKANNSPLVVVDGVIYNGSIGDINPSDIESVDILKDASSAAIYGARSASGVLIVTTKRGMTGDPRINFSAKIGVVGLTNIMRPFGPDEYLKAREDMFKQVYNKPEYYFSNPNTLPPNISIEEWKNYDATSSGDPVDMWLNRLTLTGTEKKNYFEGKTINWLDEILQNGIRQDYDFSLSGGVPKLRYYWSAGYSKNVGYVLGDEYKTIQSRINIDADVSDFLNIKLNAQFADRDQGFQKASLDGAISGSPYGQIYAEDGTMEWYTHEEAVSSNPLIYYTYRELYNKTQTLFATFSGELKLPYDFTYQISYVNRYSWNRNYQFDPLETPNGSQNNGYGRRTNNNVYEWQVDNLLKWNKTFADIHKFDITLLYNAEKFQSWQDIQTNTQFAPTTALIYHAMAAGINPSITSNDEYSTGEALMGRLNYSLMSKYLLTLTWRRDGYSAFGQANPYAEFPSAAFGWRISDENFFNVSWIDHFKIRTSWGLNGNRDIGRYDALARLATVQYVYGNALATGVYSSTMANSSLKWERTEAFNVGFDFGLLKNRFSGNIDLYSMTTRDLLMDRTLPSIIGYSSVASNLGELGNKGFELTLNSENLNIQDKIKWNSSLVFSFNRNKIKHLYGEMIDVFDENGTVIGQREADDWTNNWFIGKSIDRIWEYERLGVWQLDEADEAAVYGRRPGDIKLRDVNNDGKLQPSDDKVFQGYKTPKYRLGLRNDFSFLKNFELSVFFRADLGFYRINSIDEESSWIDRRNIYKAPYWTPENPGNEYAMLMTEKDAPYKIWKNSSFIRMQDLTLSYNLPNNMIPKIQNLKVFFNLRNYLTITKWDHWDPETGQSPMPKYFTAGINVDL